MKKRLAALFLAAAMILTGIPSSAWAEDMDYEDVSATSEFVEDETPGEVEGDEYIPDEYIPSQDEDYLTESVLGEYSEEDVSPEAEEEQDYTEAGGQDYSDTNRDVIPDLEVGVRTTVSSDSGEVFYSFTPATSGQYRIQSFSDYDVYVTLYDSDRETILGEDNQGGSNIDFFLNFDLEAGHTYYYAIRACSHSYFFCDIILEEIRSVQVILHANHSEASFDDGSESITVLLEEGIVLDSSQYQPNCSDPEIRFQGWAKDADATYAEYRITVTASEEPLELWGVWSRVKNITFHAGREDAYFVSEDDNGNPIHTEFITKEYIIGSFVSNSDFSPYCDDTRPQFIGWSTDPDAIDVYGSVWVTEELEDLYAVWSQIFTVTLNGNGGSIDGEEIYVQTYKNGQRFWVDDNLISAPDDYHSFEGWYTLPEGGRKYNNSIDKITEDITLYAHWKESHPVILDANGGSFDEYDPSETERTLKYDPAEIFASGKENIPKNTDPGVFFAGWATTPDASAPDIQYTTPAADLSRVYAVWIPGITVTIHADSEDEATWVIPNYEYGGVYDYSDAYTFCVLPGTTLEEIQNVCCRTIGYTDSGKRSRTPGGEALDPSTVLQDGDELYVIWDKKLTVTYNLGIGDLEWEEDTKTYDVQYNVKETEAPLLYSLSIRLPESSSPLAFSGWSTDPEGNHLVTKIGDLQGFIKNDAVTLYAVYTSEGHIVTLELADNEYSAGEDLGASIRTGGGWYSLGNSFLWPQGLKMSDFSYSGWANLPGYVFLGFSTTPDAEGLVGKDFEPSADMTLYGIFSEGLEITFHSSEGIFPREDNRYNNMASSWESEDHYMNMPFRKGQPLGTIPEPVPANGRVFVGWTQKLNEVYTFKTNAELETYVPDLAPGDSLSYDAVFADALPIQDAEILEAVPDVTYTGKAFKPEVKLAVEKDGVQVVLAEGTDYTLTYKNNINAGTAQIIITGKGWYTGSKTITFKIAKAASKVTLKAKTATYTGKTINIGAATVKGTKGKVTYAYYSDAKCTKKVTSHINARTYYVKATAAADANYKAATSAAVKLVINKAAQPMAVKAVTKTVKYSLVKTKAQIVSGCISFTRKAQGKVTYAKVTSGSSKYLTINKTTGKVTVAKNTKKGTYRIKVKITAAGNTNYKSGSKTITLTIKVS